MAQYIGQNIYVRPNYVITLPEYDTKRNFFTESFLKNKVNLKDNKHKGKLSVKAQKELKTAVNWLIASAKEKTVYHKETERYYTFKVNFVTLTLPDTENPITDKEFKENLLNPFLTYCRKYFNLSNYVWKMELQNNGKLHAHLTTDTFIYWKDLRKAWNRRLIACGYMKQFEEKYGHQDPNSTDVHSVYKVSNIAAYIAKYMAKNEQNTKDIKGRIWGCNYELSRNCKPKLFVWASEVAETMKQFFMPIIEYKPIMSPPDSMGQIRQFGEIFFMKAFNWNLIRNEVKDLYVETCNKIRNLTAPPQLKVDFI